MLPKSKSIFHFSGTFCQTPDAQFSGKWFSGDVDSVVPVTATRYSISQLKLTTKVPWYPWYVKNQVSFHLIQLHQFRMKGKKQKTIIYDNGWLIWMQNLWICLWFWWRWEAGQRFMKGLPLQQWEEQGMKFHCSNQELLFSFSNHSSKGNPCQNLEIHFHDSLLKNEIGEM